MRRCRLTWTHEIVEISRLDQQLFNTFLSRSDDPRAESLKAIYHGMARNDPKKKELALLWVANEEAGQKILEAQGRGIASCRTYRPWPALEATFLENPKESRKCIHAHTVFFSPKSSQHCTGTGLHHWQGSSESPEEKGEEGSSNYPFWGGSDALQMYGKIEGFPLKAP